MTHFKSILIKAVAVICVLAVPFWVVTDSAAENWPPAKTEIIISHGVGSGQGTTTRTLGEFWGELLGTQFIYKNKKGASGRIGYDYFVKQTDETAMLSSNITSASIMYAQQKPDWDWEKEIYPIGIMAVDPGAIFAHKNSPFKTLQDLIAEAKKRKITFAISYWASPDNLLMHQIMEITGAQFEIVPYGNSKDLVTQVLAGNVEAGYTKIGAIIRGGNDLNFLAMSLDENPVPEATGNAPTIDSVLGVETIGVASYRAINMHKPFADKYPERLAKIKAAFEKAKMDPAFREKAQKMGIEPGLVVNWSHERVMKTIRGYWKAFEKYGDIYKREK
jgi:tripartite-type tricarboxylate transporter receptor subunit TctC